MTELTVREATSSDAEAIAGVFTPSLRSLSFLPRLHTADEDLWFIRNVILAECRVAVTERAGEIIAFLALDGREIRLLHTHPAHFGKGAGSLLLEGAKAGSPGCLELWCFQANTAARRFYERHGFLAIEFTDGKRNEEKMPDIRYRWQHDS